MDKEITTIEMVPVSDRPSSIIVDFEPTVPTVGADNPLDTISPEIELPAEALPENVEIVDGEVIVNEGSSGWKKAGLIAGGVAAVAVAGYAIYKGVEWLRSSDNKEDNSLSDMDAMLKRTCSHPAATGTVGDDDELIDEIGEFINLVRRSDDGSDTSHVSYLGTGKEWEDIKLVSIDD